MDKIIHQIWIGDKKIPKHIKNHMKKIKENHKDFTYYLWTDSNLPEIPDNLKTIYDSYNCVVSKADLLRLYVVNLYGGIYLDADFNMINGFYSDKMLNLDFDGFITFNHSYGIAALGNGMFGFNKNNPLIEDMITNITVPNQWLGPNWWSKVICNYLKLDIEKSTLTQLEEKLGQLNIKVIDYKDFNNECFRHLDMASWIPGSDWNKKLKNGNYD